VSPYLRVECFSRRTRHTLREVTRSITQKCSPSRGELFKMRLRDASECCTRHAEQQLVQKTTRVDSTDFENVGALRYWSEAIFYGCGRFLATLHAIAEMMSLNVFAFRQNSNAQQRRRTVYRRDSQLDIIIDSLMGSSLARPRNAPSALPKAHDMPEAMTCHGLVGHSGLVGVDGDNLHNIVGARACAPKHVQVLVATHAFVEAPMQLDLEQRAKIRHHIAFDDRFPRCVDRLPGERHAPRQ